VYPFTQHYYGLPRACPTALQLLDLPWWGRRFRLPIVVSKGFFRSLSRMAVL
jgi:hypothetical protein